jgi:hypothetical protein
MRILYVAGKYRDKRGDWYVHQNIEMAKGVARQLWLMNSASLCPHANIAMFDGNDIPPERFLAGDLELLRRCDALVALPSCADSQGAQGEIAAARALAMPVFAWPGDIAALRRFIEDGNAAEDMRDA